MTTDRIHKPPNECQRLYDYFSADGLALSSTHGAYVNMATVGVGVRGQPDPDARMVNGGSVGFKQRAEAELFDRYLAHPDGDALRGERPSKAQLYRETASVLALLEPRHVRVLQLAYGPQDAIPELRQELIGSAQARASVEGPSAVKSKRSKASELGTWVQVMVETEAARTEHSKTAKGGVSLVRWLVHQATSVQKSAVRLEAHRSVVEAWGAWMVAREKLGLYRRRERVPRGFVFQRGEE